MTASAQPTSEPEPHFLSGFTPYMDFLAKGIPAIAIAVYGSGFVVISLYHSKYGFADTNPFRARILAAGVLFLFFTGIPVVTVTAVWAGKPLPWAKFAAFLYPYYLGCISFGLFTTSLFNFDSPTAAATYPFRLWPGIAILIGAGLLSGLMVWKKESPIWEAILSLLLVLTFSVSALRDLIIAKEFQQSALALWFFAIGALTLLELKIKRGPDGWPQRLFLLVGALGAFANWYYPQIKNSWGGGTPVNVVVFFAKDSAFRPNQAVVAHLIDESDAGFFIAGQNETRAVYIPRNAVSFIYFSDKPNDSQFLQYSQPSKTGRP